MGQKGIFLLLWVHTTQKKTPRVIYIPNAQEKHVVFLSAPTARPAAVTIANHCPAPKWLEVA